MPEKKILPHGAWPSPFDAASVAKGARRFGKLQAAGSWLYWTESRPEERGRQTIMRLAPGHHGEDILPAPFSARSRVHEYGGGEFVACEACIYFVNGADQDIYELAPGDAPKRLTRSGRTRFADLAYDPARQRLVAVAERPIRGRQYPQNLIVAVALSGTMRGTVTDLVTGHDFFADPRLSPDGSRLAFVAWDLPDMPWDQSTLHVAPVTKGGAVRRLKTVAGGGGASASQPEWGPDGTLYFVLDAPGSSGLHAMQNDGRIRHVPTGVTGELSRPPWVFGTRSYAIGGRGAVAVSQIDRGIHRVAVIRLRRGRAAQKPTLRTLFRSIEQPVAYNGGFAGLATRDTAPAAVVEFGSQRPRVLRTACEQTYAPGMISKGRVMAFRDGARSSVYGVFYAPANSACRAPLGALPPLVVLVHGGPTAMTDRGFKPRIQYLTSRGFAVLDLDYSGSTGYGRAYRERLDGRWGELDVSDAGLAARQLADKGHVDGSRMAIAGGSAGGYTVLMALATTTVFAAGSSHYGISDLGLLLAHTHKFESGYLHRLMGTTPEDWRDTFDARSPLNLAGGISCPVILFQGLDDKVVPPEQSRRIVDELEQRGIDVAYHEFEGEGHGFRRSETIIAVLEAELAFLRNALRLG